MYALYNLSNYYSINGEIIYVKKWEVHKCLKSNTLDAWCHI